MSDIITMDYEGMQVDFTTDAWFNATAVASRFGKLPNEWLRLPEATEYLKALERKYGKIPHFKTRRGRGGGTWMHPRLGVAFARWLDVDFAIWCDEQIDRLLRGEGMDWRRLRHEAASSFKVMTDAILYTRNEAGKNVAPYHFSNEARLVNWALSGQFVGLDRDAMAKADLDLLGKLEVRNTVLIAQGLDYETRKRKLHAFAAAWRCAHPDTKALEVA
ncbi:KilA-N domain-containing protein [Pusillimonas noertemannii]|uniref:KilA domain-containing protein n=1 Tax=Pusillimonas noertemannii TaxID=305977 RepID=A0A2U1CS15_9BURK|nr:KilA-N domain-containing protein [Pusillimonas noertemannii]NYT67982.1 KilA-N domain-containing protein [Pusillimonas noertemannii]PVY68659.1 KilA domain-containing protein [Pusillimonas noertemannii]TFL11877.1 KilA-N domain-containing protein [Pusillimonas noertemannii]